jgi:hypothetical protein
MQIFWGLFGRLSSLFALFSQGGEFIKIEQPIKNAGKCLGVIWG